jgi:hypothetical protein
MPWFQRGERVRHVHSAYESENLAGKCLGWKEWVESPVERERARKWYVISAVYRYGGGGGCGDLEG